MAGLHTGPASKGACCSTEAASQAPTSVACTARSLTCTCVVGPRCRGSGRAGSASRPPAGAQQVGVGPGGSRWMGVVGSFMQRTELWRCPTDQQQTSS
jgi:hypothetical protein